MIELIHLGRQFRSMKADIMAGIEDTLDSGAYILGPKVKRFEAETAAMLGTAHAIGVANGTDALVLTLDACGIGPGDEVITTPFTFIASAEAISRVGATPVFADVDPVTCNIDPACIEAQMTAATKAIIAVHLFGQTAEMDDIMALAERKGITVIEDACQAFGASYKGRPAGSLGHAACFSFFPSKNLGTMGDGGMVVTSDDALAARVRQLRHHGSSRKYYHARIGYNSRLDEIHAAILLAALPRLAGWNDGRRRLAQRYRSGLEGHPYVYIAPETEEHKHIYHLFCLMSDRRSELRQALEQSAIQCGVYYPCPLHLQEAYRGLGYGEGDFPVAERLSERLLALPMSPFLTDDEQDVVLDCLWQSVGRARR